ncbi:sporulation protein YqfD [Oceanobacillus kapialis]|uniref:Sporulation protein YqfD n=1 Tax=Oceanobacillus kapialis TaxID=481353 RepID=A0ABW5Q5K9_9BACI
MKQLQDSYLAGYVTLSVKGEKPELFFQHCTSAGITVWNVKKKFADRCEGNIKLRDVKYIRKLNKQTNYKLKFIDRKGYPFMLRRFVRRKELLLGVVLSMFLILFLSNIIWEVKITGVPKDIEEKISKQLEKDGIHPGAWIFSLKSPNEIQQQLVKDVPELLWVGVEQKGTTFTLEGVEKIIVEEEEPVGPRDLVATKKGVIKKMYVSNGVAQVQVNDYVEPGDTLVSGVINDSTSEEEKEDKGEQENRELVAADGEIIATTWYEVNVTAPLQTSSENLTGAKEKKFSLKTGDFHLPIWGFGTPDYEAIHRETNETPIQFLKWELPIHFVETILSEKTYTNVERSKEDSIKAGIEQAKQELALQLGPEAVIVSEKVLHETIENGKVKLNLYINVEENIAKAQPLSQGD